MRIIEQKMLAAIRARRSWHGSNTSVRANGSGFIAVLLHGNHIADVEPETGALRFTLAGWNTPTTRSRVNALLSAFGAGRVHQSKFLPYYRPAANHGGLQISSRDWINAGVQS